MTAENNVMFKLENKEETKSNQNKQTNKLLILKHHQQFFFSF